MNPPHDRERWFEEQVQALMKEPDGMDREEAEAMTVRLFEMADEMVAEMRKGGWGREEVQS